MCLTKKTASNRSTRHCLGHVRKLHSQGSDERGFRGLVIHCDRYAAPARCLPQPLGAPVERGALREDAFFPTSAPPPLAWLREPIKAERSSSHPHRPRPRGLTPRDLSRCSAVPPGILRVHAGAVRDRPDLYVGRIPSGTRPRPGRKAVTPFAAERSGTKKRIPYRVMYLFVN